MPTCSFGPDRSIGVRNFFFHLHQRNFLGELQAELVGQRTVNGNPEFSNLVFPPHVAIALNTFMDDLVDLGQQCLRALDAPRVGGRRPCVFFFFNLWRYDRAFRHERARIIEELLAHVLTRPVRHVGMTLTRMQYLRIACQHVQELFQP